MNIKDKKNHIASATRYMLNIGWLYPDLMSIYGDRGNIIALQKRCEWRGISCTITPIYLTSNIKSLMSCDMLFMGGAQDSQQTIVAQDLKDNKGHTLSGMIQDGIPGLYICGAYQFLGKYYKEADGTIINGLGIFDLHTENLGSDKPRLIGNVTAEINNTISHIPFAMNTIVGFENHGGRTYLGRNIQPLAKVIKGFGNNGKDNTEGAVYKNSIGSYFHGPILPKNPHLADWLIQKALGQKYKKDIMLDPIDDTLAYQAHKEIIRKFSM